MKWHNIPEDSNPQQLHSDNLTSRMYVFVYCSQLYCLNQTEQTQSEGAEHNNETNEAYFDSDLWPCFFYFCICIMHKTQPCFIISMLLSTSDRVHSVCASECVSTSLGRGKSKEASIKECVSHINTFTAIVDLSRFNNSCLKSPAATLVDLTFQSRVLRSFSLNQLRNLSL